jgi:hypothetical protein
VVNSHELPSVYNVLMCVYKQLYLSCPKYEDFHVCSVIDEFIREPRNCLNQGAPFFIAEFWYEMEVDVQQQIIKNESKKPEKIKKT